ncbi:MAG TPA: TlpA disulfide reductase family protein [Gemmatimonadaceae bacterium]|nr:TlpA disulfide reductase family protein [Gemmatimonadaceae bacterium]
MMTRRLASALLVVALAVAACTSGDGSGSVQVGKPVPEYRAVSVEGDTVSLAAQRGKVVLFNVWATWCHPCRDEIPELLVLYEKYKPRGLELVGVSIDANGSDEAIRSFMKDFRMTYPVWRDPDERVSTEFLVVGVPATFLIDRNGTLRWRKTGPIQPGDSSLTAAIEQALGS